MTIPVYNMTDTWNDAGTAFSAVRMDVTDTASGSDSLFLDFRINGGREFWVDKTGTVSARGLDVFVFNPRATGNAGVWQTASINTTWTDLAGLNPNYANLEMLAINTRIWHADATLSGQTSAKTTQLPISIYSQYNSGGQRFMLSRVADYYGMGDAFINTQRMTYGGGPLPGDEGFGYSSVGECTQPKTLTLDTIGSVTRALGNTTITQTLVANKNPQTVTVASTAGMVVGDWYQVQRQTPHAVYNSEAIQVLAIGAGTITALFRLNVASGATLTPALVIGGLNSYPAMGQLRVLVNLSGASYSTGQITVKMGGALQGTGMTWSPNMVGGDSINIGAISLDKDTYAGYPLNGTGINGPMRAWWEIQQAFTQQVDVASFSIAGAQDYRSSRWAPPSTYVIRPAVRILRNLGNGTVVCETTTTTWSVGDQIEQAVCPYPDCIGDGRQCTIYTPGATARSLFSITNGGPVPFQAGLVVSGTGPASDTGYKFSDGVIISGGDTGLHISGSVSSDITLQNTVGKIKWQDAAVDPYIEKNASGTLNFVYGGLGGTFGGLFTAPIVSGLCTAEFRVSRLGVTGNGGGAGTDPYIRLARHAGLFEAAATAIDIRQDTTPIVGGGYRGLDFRVYGTSSLSVSEFSMGTNGIFQCLPGTMTCVNGANGAKPITKSFMRITGPTGAFSIAGFSNPAPAAGGSIPNGSVLYLYNSTTQVMTLKNDTGSIGDILTLAGVGAAGDVVLGAGPSAATLIYNEQDQRWILMSTQG